MYYKGQDSALNKDDVIRYYVKKEKTGCNFRKDDVLNKI